MRIMYLTIEGFDTPNANNHLALTMIDDMLKANIEVYMVSSNRLGNDPDIPNVLHERKGFSYDIITRQVVDKSNFIKRYFEGLQYAKKAKNAWKNKIETIDAVIVQATPTAFLSVWYLERILKKPIIYSIFDLFPDWMVDVGVMNAGFKYWFLQKIQNYIYKHSTKVISITEDMRKKLLKKPYCENKVEVIVNWYDENSVKEISIEKNKFIKKYKLRDDNFYIQYAGNFGFTFDYKMVINVAEKLKQYEKVKFQMIGEGQFLDKFKKEVKEKKLDNIIFYPWQSLDIISDVYSACSIAFIPLSKGVIGNSFPSKLSLLMACGRIAVTTSEANTEYFKMINENNIGLCIDRLNPDKVASAIINLYENPIERNIMEKNARVYGREKFSSTVNTKKYIEVCKKVCKERS